MNNDNDNDHNSEIILVAKPNDEHEFPNGAFVYLYFFPGSDDGDADHCGLVRRVEAMFADNNSIRFVRRRR
jgi:hypothetical protein